MFFYSFAELAQAFDHVFVGTYLVLCQILTGGRDGVFVVLDVLAYVTGANDLGEGLQQGTGLLILVLIDKNDGTLSVEFNILVQEHAPLLWSTQGMHDLFDEGEGSSELGVCCSQVGLEEEKATTFIVGIGLT